MLNVRKLYMKTILLNSILFIVASTAPAMQSGDFTYEINPLNKDTAIITGYTGSGGDVTIPSTIDDQTVVSIGEDAFSRNESLESITIPNSILSVGDNAFVKCSGLTNVNFGSSVTSIGESAFSACGGLTEVTLPDSVTTIGDEAFYGCGSLTNITFGENMSTLGQSPFASSSLISITVPKGNQTYRSDNGVLFSKDRTTLVQWPPGREAGDYSIPDGIELIASNAFHTCIGLTSISMPDSVTIIDNDAFSNCSGLTNVTFGSNISSIGQFAFSMCHGLTEITIPDNVTQMKYGAFYHCTKLASVTLGEKLSMLEMHTFDACIFENITIPESVTFVEKYAFQQCANLKGVYFKGHAPDTDGGNVYYSSYSAINYYLPEKSGWTSSFGGRPAISWNPNAQSSRVDTNGFTFSITGNNNEWVKVETCDDLEGNNWYPLTTSQLSSGSASFSDPNWTNYPCRYYRMVMP